MLTHLLIAATIVVPSAATVTVVSGDTLSGIADSHGISLRAIEADNPMANFNLIIPGETIHLGPHAATAAFNAPNSILPATMPGGAFGVCVVARESGGRAQIMNSSMHYGLYQFSESTWIAYGGSSATFGHASVSEQNRIFSDALAQNGKFNWTPWDGCK